MAERLPGQPAQRDDSELQLGRFRFGVVYRTVSADEGPTLHVFGPARGQAEEVLRFDCFKNQPHYHLAFSYNNTAVHPIEADDPFAWVVDHLKDNFQDLLARAEAEPPTADELAGLPALLQDVAARRAALPA